MQISIDFWQLVLLLLTFFAACAGAGKLLLAQTQRHLDDRFTMMGTRLDGIESANRDEANQWRQVERDLMSLKSDLPLRFVMRDDYIRGQSIIEAKIDGLAVKLENAQLRGLVGAQKNVD
jgi:hypothetical protein